MVLGAVVSAHTFMSFETARTKPTMSPLFIFDRASTAAAFAESGRPATLAGSKAAVVVLRLGKALVDWAAASGAAASNASATKTRIARRFGQAVMRAVSRSPPRGRFTGVPVL